MNIEDRLVGAEDLVEYMGVNNAQAVMRLMRKGTIPAQKIAGKWRTKTRTRRTRTRTRTRHKKKKKKEVGSK